jgi:hypothetical protein
VILTATTAAIMPLFDGVTDADYAIQGTGVVLCILGAVCCSRSTGRRCW